jgi:hypothetical protein
MNRRLCALALTLPLLAVTACNNSAPPSTPASAPTSAPTAAPTTEVKPAQAKATSVITGTALGPVNHVGRVIPVGGANVVASGGSNVVPVGGGNVVPVGGGHAIFPAIGQLRRVQAVQESPLANATVFLADAGGNPYPGLASTTTDAQGKFTFNEVPAGYTFMVVVAAQDQSRGKEVTLQTLVHPTELGATTNIDTSTSLVTLAVTQGQSGLGEFNAAAFRTATEATAKQLKAEDVPDLSDRSAILAKVDQLSQSIAELKQALDDVKQDLKDIKDQLDAINQKLSASPSPTPTPAPTQPAQTGMTQPPPPPPGGQPAGPCLGTVQHGFVLTGTYPAQAYPIRLDFIAPMGALVASTSFASPGAVATATLPVGCQHRLVLKNKDFVDLNVRDGYIVPVDAPYQVQLPF